MYCQTNSKCIAHGVGDFSAHSSRKINRSIVRLDSRHSCSTIVEYFVRVLHVPYILYGQVLCIYSIASVDRVMYDNRVHYIECIKVNVRWYDAWYINPPYTFDKDLPQFCTTLFVGKWFFHNLTVNTSRIYLINGCQIDTRLQRGLSSVVIVASILCGLMLYCPVCHY